MKSIYLLFFSIFSLVATSIYGQEPPKQKSPEEMAYEQATKLEERLKLEPHQTFYVDSILQHDMKEWFKEMDELQKSGKQEYSVFKQVQDKWMDKIEGEYKKIFTKDQWTEYLKYMGKYKKPKKNRNSKRDKATAN
jgi:hypothetical protein